MKGRTYFTSYYALARAKPANFFFQNLVCIFLVTNKSLWSKSNQIIDATQTNVVRSLLRGLLGLLLLLLFFCFFYLNNLRERGKKIKKESFRCFFTLYQQQKKKIKKIK